MISYAALAEGRNVNSANTFRLVAVPDGQQEGCKWFAGWIVG
jgi:hypothetical protein